MDKLPDTGPMENPPLTPPLGGLNPADLLRQGAAKDTFAGADGFQPPSLEEMTALFPQFEILELIGKGGMGAVYKVRQKELDRIVALKILPPAIGQSSEFSARFTREAKALAKLNHPGIVTLYEFGQAEGLYFILMEYVDGVNLAQLMKTSRISPREALAIVPQICDALQFAHDQGIVHRDIKPENILLDRSGRVKVADFGIAKVVAAVCEDPIRSGDIPVPTDQTIAGKIIGTPQYMAPEQIDHPADVDHRADIYALGIVFYQMLTGELPGKRIEAPSKKVHIDVRLDQIVLKAMEKEPEMRYQTAYEFRTVVDDIQTPALAPPELKQKVAVAHQRSVGTWVGIGCGVIVLMLCIASIIAAVVFWFIRPLPNQAKVEYENSSELIPKAAAHEMAALEEVQIHSAKQWLSEIDEGNYAQSWKDAAIFFQNAITEVGWSNALAKVRKPLGEVKSRKLLGAQNVKSLPGAPDGEYVVMQFDTSFAAKEKAVETVTFMLEKDGSWKATGYFIR